MLTNDRLLGPVLPERARVIFRGARSIQEQVAPNMIDPLKKCPFFSSAKATTPVANVMCASIIMGGRHKTDCHKQYVGRTIRTFSTRVNEHVTGIKDGKSKHTVPGHYLQFHNKDPTGTLFQVIDKFVPHWRGESRLRGVSCLETYWIHELRSYFPFGLNVEWDLNSFINQS